MVLAGASAPQVALARPSGKGSLASHSLRVIWARTSMAGTIR